MSFDDQECKNPIEEIHRIRQEISAAYGHDPEKLNHAVVEQQKQCVREGQVFWGYNEAGELAPLPKDSISGVIG